MSNSSFRRLRPAGKVQKPQQQQGRTNTGSSAPQKKRASTFKKVGSVFSFISKRDGKEGMFVSVDNFFGDLLFRDKRTGIEYNIKSLSCFEPRNENAPNSLMFDVVVNLSNQEQAVPVGTMTGGSFNNEDEENPQTGY